MRGFIETVGNHLRGSQGVLDFFFDFFPFPLYPSIFSFNMQISRIRGYRDADVSCCDDY